MPALGQPDRAPIFAHRPQASWLFPIGTGGSLSASPLPHHRTYGSVSGGSADYAGLAGASGRAPWVCRGHACRPMPSGSRRAAPAEAARCRRAVGYGSSTSGVSFRWAARSATVISSMPGALVALDLRQRLPSGYHARQPAPSTAQGAPGFRHQLAPPWLQSLRHSRSGLHPSPPCQRPVQLNLLPLGHGEVAALIATSCRSGLRCCHLLCPRLTSAPRSRDPLSPGSTAFTAHPPNLPPRPSMALDFAISCSLVRPGRPHIRFLSIGSLRTPPRSDALALR